MTQEATDFSLGRRIPTGTLAVLADGENLSRASVEPLLGRLLQAGTPTILRAYCDRLNPNGWDKDPRFQVTYLDTLAGKNSADIRLVIDAMDIAHASAVDSFALLSTDRDFAALAHRLRASGFWVLGAGRAETSAQFRLACSEFHALPGVEDRRPPAAEPAPLTVDQRILKAVRAEAALMGLLPLGPLGNTLRTKHALAKTDCGLTTWSAYFRSRPELYEIVGEGPATCLRLRGPRPVPR